VKYEFVWSTDGMILTGEHRSDRRKTCPCHFVHNGIQTNWPGNEPGSRGWNAGN